MIRLALFLTLFALPAHAACYADYKAKRDNPLRLHYGVAEVECDADIARRTLQNRLGQNGWTLLNVMSVFGPEGLEERKASAGDYFLRF